MFIHVKVYSLFIRRRGNRPDLNTRGGRPIQDPHAGNELSIPAFNDTDIDSATESEHQYTPLAADVAADDHVYAVVQW